MNACDMPARSMLPINPYLVTSTHADYDHLRSQVPQAFTMRNGRISFHHLLKHYESLLKNADAKQLDSISKQLQAMKQDIKEDMNNTDNDSEDDWKFNYNLEKCDELLVEVARKKKEVESHQEEHHRVAGVRAFWEKQKLDGRDRVGRKR